MAILFLIIDRPMDIQEVKHVFYGEVLADSKPKMNLTAVDVCNLI